MNKTMLNNRIERTGEIAVVLDNCSGSRPPRRRRSYTRYTDYIMKNIIVELKKLTNSDDDLSIIVEISPDEAVIIGTRQAFINAAVKLLEIAGKSSTVDIDRDDLSEGPVDYTNYIKYAFNEFGDVWPVVAYIAKNQEQAETIKAHLKG